MDKKNCPKNENKNMAILKGGSWFPDGDYKVAIKLYSNIDEEIISVVYYYRMKTGDNRAFWISIFNMIYSC